MLSLDEKEEEEAGALLGPRNETRALWPSDLPVPGFANDEW